MSKTRTVTLCGEVYVEVLVGDGADGETEIQNVFSVSTMIGRPGKSIQLDLTGLRMVVDSIADEPEILLALIAEQDKAEAQQAQQDAAEDSAMRR